MAATVYLTAASALSAIISVSALCAAALTESAGFKIMYLCSGNVMAAISLMCSWRGYMDVQMNTSFGDGGGGVAVGSVGSVGGGGTGGAPVAGRGQLHVERNVGGVGFTVGTRGSIVH